MSGTRAVDLVAIGVTSAIVALAIGVTLAQEKPARAMRQWTMGEVAAGEWNTPPKARIDVFDTEGVCLYIARSMSEAPVAIVAVPKTQLPKGAGCQ